MQSVNYRNAANELIVTATQLLGLARKIEGQSEAGTAHTPAPSMVALAEKIYNQRRLRNNLFDEPDLFGEPAWDILIDMYINTSKNKCVSVTSSCIASGAPMTTALRWLKTLEKRGYIFREGDDTDGRRSFIKLTYKGYDKINKYLYDISKL